MHDSYNQSIFNLGVFGAATSFGWVFFSFVFGKIGDRYSKMAAVRASTIICIFSFMIIAIVNNFPLLFFASFLLGASKCLFGFVWAVTGSAAPDCYVGRWVSISQASINFVSFGAPIIGGLLYGVSPHIAFFTTVSLLSVLVLMATFKRL